MKAWITLGLVKKRVNKKFKYVYVLNRGKPIRKTSIYRNSHPLALKHFLKRKPKNPLTQKINFLHGIHQVLKMAKWYCMEFIVPEVEEYCGTDRIRDIRNLRVLAMSENANLCNLDDLVERIHDSGCKKEDVDTLTYWGAELFKNLDIPNCPCSSTIYCHYYRKMKKCLTKDNVAFSSRYLNCTQNLKNKRTFFLTLQKCVDAMYVSNTKHYN
ncbi:hypothetical protein BgiBS90_016753 [Biomphalaria glabrata]|nr:hypothetical protein BgiBS90_016753 [Biomphalaria glabrata]